MTISPEALEKARGIAFDFDCDWTADGRRQGNREYQDAINAIAAALQAERDAAAPKLPDDLAGLVERLESHMGRQEVAVLLADCRTAAATIQSLAARNAELRAEIAALKKEAADVVRPFAEMPLEGTFGGPLCGAKGLYEDGSEPEYNPDRSILGREPFCAARSFLDELEGRE